MKHDLRKG